MEELRSFRLEYQKIIRTLESSSLINGHEIIKTLLFNKLNGQTTRKVVEAIGIDFTYDAFDAQLLKLTRQMEFCRSQEEKHDKIKPKVNVNAALVHQSSPVTKGC